MSCFAASLASRDNTVAMRPAPGDRSHFVFYNFLGNPVGGMIMLTVTLSRKLQLLYGYAQTELPNTGLSSESIIRALIVYGEIQRLQEKTPLF